MNKILIIALIATTCQIISCATPKQAVRPAISQTAVTVQRHDQKTDEGGVIGVVIDDKKGFPGRGLDCRGDPTIPTNPHKTLNISQKKLYIRPKI